MKAAKDNRFLLVNKGVELTPSIERVIVGLDPYFEAAGKVGHVTSGFRSALDQLHTIRGYLAKKGLDKTYPDAITCGLKDMKQWEGKTVYVWQPAWSALLNAGIIINPPLEAELLMDYIGKTGKNRKGDKFPPSSHGKGVCFDIGGGVDGIDGDTVSEQKIVQKALDDKLPGLRGIVLERNNNCVHCDCENVSI